jgi:hypothetical protein
MDFGRRLDRVSRYKRKAGPTIYEFTHYMEQDKRKKIRDDEKFREICWQLQIPRHIRANNWKPTKVEMIYYEKWHKENIGELDRNWNQFINVPLYNLKDSHDN